MKKKLALLLSMLLAVGTLAGCGSSEEQQNTSTEADTEFAEYSDVAVNKPVEEYVTMGEYNGVEVVYAKTPVTQEEIDALALEIYWDSVTEENGGVKDRAVQIGDTANIDYVGKKDGEAFSGGTSSGYNLTIGSGTFIDGFEDGLVGVMPGDTVDLDLTFPENYKNLSYIKTPDEKYFECRDSFFGFPNNHINEKGHTIIAKQAVANVKRILIDNDEAILEEELVVDLITNN